MIIHAILRNNNEPALGNVAVTINDPDGTLELNELMQGDPAEQMQREQQMGGMM